MDLWAQLTNPKLQWTLNFIFSLETNPCVKETGQTHARWARWVRQARHGIAQVAWVETGTAPFFCEKNKFEKILTLRDELWPCDRDLYTEHPGSLRDILEGTFRASVPLINIRTKKNR